MTPKELEMSTKHEREGSKVDVIGGFPYADPNCKGCGNPLIVENSWMTDGCPCNSALGTNSMNETRWRLLMQLQQQQDAVQQQQDQAMQGLQAQNHRLMTQLGEEIAESDELVKQRDDFTQQLAEQRAEIERLKCQWQPIETAPRDGTYILLGWFLEGGGGGHPEVAFWHSTKQLWCSSRLLNAEGYYSPTHWQPLPEPPKEIKPCA